MSEEISVPQTDSPLNMVDSGINVFDVVGGHKLRVPTGVEDPARHAAQEVLQQSPHHVDRHLLRAQVYSLSWQKWERKGLNRAQVYSLSWQKWERKGLNKKTGVDLL